MRILLTGASGFLGTAIADQLLEAGHELRVLLRHPEKWSCRRSDLIEIVEGDLLRLDQMPRLFDGLEAVCHAGGLAHTEGDRESYKALNVDATSKLSQLAGRAGVRRLVLISSVAVYSVGNDGGKPAPCPPTLYAISKFEAEEAARKACSASQIELVILRMAPLVGAGGRGNLARLIQTVSQGRFVWVGNGSNLKSLLHRNDAARAASLALITPRPPIHAFDIAGPDCTMQELVTAIANATDRGLPAWHLPKSWAEAALPVLARIPKRGRAWAHTLERWLADESYPTDAFQHWCGWTPQISLAAAVLEQARAQCPKVRLGSSPQ